AGLAGRLCAAGLYGMNVHGEAIAFLDPVDGNRPALRIEERKLQFCRWAILFAGDDATESVFGLDHNDIAGLDRENWFGVRPIDVMKGTLLLDREFMALSGLTLGKATCRHDR